MDTLSDESDDTVCLICFQITEKFIFVPDDVSAKIVDSCNTYLHSTLSTETLKNIQLQNGNQLPFCKNCFDSALELTQLSEQLATFQKDISDLTINFSLAVFHRRSQVCNSQLQNSSQSLNKSSIIEFNASCLPSHLFSTENENIQQSSKNSNCNIIFENNQDDQCTEMDIANVKIENSDFQLICQPYVDEEENEEIFCSVDRPEKLNNPRPIQIRPHLKPQKEIKIVQVTGRNECSKTSSEAIKGAQVSMSDLMKSVKMPEIKLKRLEIESQKLDGSAVNSFKIKSEPGEELIDTCTNELNPNYVPDHSSNSKQLQRLHCENAITSAPSRIILDKTLTGEKRFECSFCQKEFIQLSTMKIHERIHTGEKPFKCSFCEKKFTTRGNQKIHERTHTWEIPFKCTHCEKTFTGKKALKIHQNSHTGEEMFNCSFCAKTFTSLSAVEVHERTHSGEKPFKCNRCEKSFNALCSLQMHENTHAKKKPFKCSFCAKRFTSLPGMNVHKRIHTGEKPFKCSFCEKRYISAGTLNHHELTHPEGRRFACSFCEKSFASQSALQTHERIHTGEKPFKCLYCDKTFRQKGNRNIHQMTHRNKKSSLLCSFCAEKCDSLAELRHHEQMHSNNEVAIKCSFCEMTFSQEEDRIVHEQTHSTVDERNNIIEDFIVGL